MTAGGAIVAGVALGAGLTVGAGLTWYLANRSRLIATASDVAASQALGEIARQGIVLPPGLGLESTISRLIANTVRGTLERELPLASLAA